MEPDVEATRFLEYFLIGGVDVTHGLTPEDEKICGEDRDDKGDTYSLPPRRHSVISYNSLHMKENGRKSSIKDTPNENKNVLESSSARKQASENGDGGGLDVPKVTKLPPLDLTYNSEGLFRYPVEDYAATPLIPSRVLSFCFPEGVMISKEYKQPKFHSFVITTETGARMYGGALVFYEPLEKALRVQLEGMYEAHNKEVNGGETVTELPVDLYLPKCLTLMTHLPLILTLKDILAHLYMLSQQPNYTDLERAIVNVCKEIPVPPSGLAEVKIALTPQPIFVSRPAVNYFHPSSTDYTFDTVFRCLPVHCVVELFTRMLYEHRIVLLSSSLDKLHVVAETLCSFLYPFYWQHVYIPVLPATLVAFLGAPMPYLIGMDAKYKSIAMNEGGMGEDIVYANLDEGHLMCASAAAITLPQHIQRKLTARLESAVNVYGQYASEDKQAVFSIASEIPPSKSAPSRPPPPIDHPKSNATRSTTVICDTEHLQRSNARKGSDRSLNGQRATTSTESLPTTRTRRVRKPTLSPDNDESKAAFARGQSVAGRAASPRPVAVLPNSLPELLTGPPKVPERTYKSKLTKGSIKSCESVTKDVPIKLHMTYATNKAISSNINLIQDGPPAGGILSEAEINKWSKSGGLAMDAFSVSSSFKLLGGGSSSPKVIASTPQQLNRRTVLAIDTSQGASQLKLTTRQNQTYKGHAWEQRRFLTATYCSACGKTVGALANAILCVDCGFVCHKSKSCASVTGSCGPRFNSSSVRDGFLLVFIALISNYREYMLENGEFRDADFLEDCNEDYRPILEMLVHTQAFVQFIVERSERDPRDYEVLFFDQHIARKSARTAKSKLFNNKQDTPFLDDPSYLITQTHNAEVSLHRTQVEMTEKLPAERRPESIMNAFVIGLDAVGRNHFRDSYAFTSMPAAQRTQERIPQSFVVYLNPYTNNTRQQSGNRRNTPVSLHSTTSQSSQSKRAALGGVRYAQTTTLENKSTAEYSTNVTATVPKGGSGSSVSVNEEAARRKFSVPRSPSALKEKTASSMRLKPNSQLLNLVDVPCYTPQHLTLIRFPTDLCTDLCTPREPKELANEASRIKLKANTVALARKARIDKARRNKAMKTLTALPADRDFSLLDEKQREVMFSMAVDFVHHQITKATLTPIQMQYATKATLLSVLEVLYSQQQLLMDALDLSQGTDETNEVHTEMRTLQTQIAAHLDQLSQVSEKETAQVGSNTKVDIDKSALSLGLVEGQPAFERKNSTDQNVWNLAMRVNP